MIKLNMKRMSLIALYMIIDIICCNVLDELPSVDVEHGSGSTGFVLVTLSKATATFRVGLSGLSVIDL